MLHVCFVLCPMAIFQQVDRFRSLSQEISGLSSLMHFDMVRLDCKELKQGLIKKAETFSKVLVGKLVNSLHQSSLQ